MEENADCIMKAFQEHPIFIYEETSDDNKIHYYRASDIGNLLELTNIRVSIQNFSKTEKCLRKVNTIKGMQNILFLTSNGVYRLLYSSKKELAEKFRDWAGSILSDIIYNESAELRKQLAIKDQEIERLKLQHSTDLENKEKEKHWLHLLTKNQITYKKFTTKRDGVYQGSSEFENQNYIEKIGKTVDIKNRARDLSTATSPNNAFQMYKNYSLYKDMHGITERYIHAILQPFRILSDDTTAKEHFMVHRTFVEKIIDKIVTSQDETINMVNKYIELLDEHEFNYENVAKILDNNTGIIQGIDLTKKTCVTCSRDLDTTCFYLKDDGIYVDNCNECINFQSEILLNKIDKNPLNGIKICKKCDRALNFNMFYINKDNIDIVWDDCRECHNTYIGNPTKQCVDCLEVYQYNKFSTSKHSKDGHKTRCNHCTSILDQEKLSKRIKVICEYCYLQVLNVNLKEHHKTKMCLHARNVVIQESSIDHEILVKLNEVDDNENEVDDHSTATNVVDDSEEYEPKPKTNRTNIDDSIQNISKKQCTDCKQILTLNNFYLKDATSNVYRSKCKSCCYKINKEHSKKVKYNPLYGKKECNCCNILLDYELFFSDESKEDGFLDTCIGCYNKDKTRSKQCNKCKIIKVVTEFASDKTHSDGRSSACRKCRMEAERIRRASKPKVQCEFCHKIVGSIKEHQKTKTCMQKQIDLKQNKSKEKEKIIVEG